MLENCKPNSIVTLETENDDRFYCIFFYLVTFIQDWPHCRPVLIIDGTFLNAKYRGTLLTVCGMDANEKIFPLAFAVVESKNIGPWEWFLTKVKNVIRDEEDMVVISDRHEGILHGVKEVYPNAEHNYCMRHLLNTIRKNFNELSMDVIGNSLMLLRHTELRNGKVTYACLIMRTVASEGSLRK